MVSSTAREAQYALVDRGAPDLFRVWQEIERENAGIDVLDGKQTSTWLMVIIKVLWRTSADTYVSSCTASWIFDCKRTGKLLDRADYVIDRPRSPLRKATRHAFTPDEDVKLAKFLYRHSDKGRQGRAVYSLMEKRYPRHTEQSWRERYKQNARRIDALIDQYGAVVQRRRDASARLWSDDEREHEGRRIHLVPATAAESSTSRKRRRGQDDDDGDDSSGLGDSSSDENDEGSRRTTEQAPPQRRTRSNARAASPEDKDTPAPTAEPMDSRNLRETNGAVAGKGSATSGQAGFESESADNRSDVEQEEDEQVIAPIRPAPANLADMLRAEKMQGTRALPADDDVAGPGTSEATTAQSNGAARAKHVTRLTSSALPERLYDDDKWSGDHLSTLLSAQQYDDLLFCCSGNGSAALEMAKLVALGSIPSGGHSSLVDLGSAALEKLESLRKYLWSPEEDELLLRIASDETPELRHLLTDVHGSAALERRLVFLQARRAALAAAGQQRRRFPFDVESS